MIICNTIDDIKKFTKIREPMLLIDYAEIEFDNIVYAKKLITGNEFFMKGHYPNNPIVPGCSLIEIMSQASGLLMGNRIISKGEQPRLVGVENARFLREIKKRDNLEIYAKKASERHGIYLSYVKAYVDNVCVGKVIIKQYFIDN